MNRRSIVWAFAASWAVAAGRVAAQPATINGEVVKIDKSAGRVTLKHGEIKSLEIPAMTLSWRVQPPRQLDDIAVGDRVRFAPARIDGQYTITTLNKVPP